MEIQQAIIKALHFLSVDAGKLPFIYHHELHEWITYMCPLSMKLFPTEDEKEDMKNFIKMANTLYIFISDPENMNNDTNMQPWILEKNILDHYKKRSDELQQLADSSQE